MSDIWDRYSKIKILLTLRNYMMSESKEKREINEILQPYLKRGKITVDKVIAKLVKDNYLEGGASQSILKLTPKAIKELEDVKSDEAKMTLQDYVPLQTKKLPYIEHRINFLGYHYSECFYLAKNKIQILNLIFTYFKYISNDIVNKLVHNPDVEIELVLTYRLKTEKQKEKGINFVTLRNQDEGRTQDELSRMQNECLFEIFLALLNIAKEDTNALRRITIIESRYYPVISMYIFDDELMFIGPYLAFDCKEVPIFHVNKNSDKILWFTLKRHFDTVRGPVKVEEEKEYLDETEIEDEEVRSREGFYYYDLKEKKIRNIKTMIREGQNYDKILKILDNNSPDNKLSQKYISREIPKGNLTFDQIMTDINKELKKLSKKKRKK